MHQNRFLRMTYWIGFIFSFHVALTIYVNSSFLATKIPEFLVGILYSASALIAIMGLFLVPRLVGQFGSRLVLFLLIVLNIGNIIGMIYGTSPLISIICFTLFFAFNTLIYLGLDIMIERWSTETIQGTVRGFYLTAINMGFMIAPLIAGYVTERLGFTMLYSFAILLVIPILLLVALKLPSVRQTHQSHTGILSLAATFLKTPQLRGVFIINFLLQFFYAWMVIYMPLYLHEHIGMPWDKIGILFTVMLSAFVIFQYLFGKLADRFHIERHGMTLGLMIMGIATLFIIKFSASPFLILAAAFFASRIGASMVEVMTESYFFKRVGHADMGSIGFFRNTYPFAYILAPIVASILLQFFNLGTVFIILGGAYIIIALLFIPFTLRLKYSA